MELKQLLFFKTIAEFEHITKAAQKLDVAQSYLSKVMSDLEEELGLELFDHVGRQIKLNQKGRVLYKYVSQIFSTLDDAKRELDDISSNSENQVSVATSSSLYMAMLLGNFKTLVPYAKIYQYSAKRHEMIKMMLEGEIDYALCTPPITGPDFESIVVIEEVCAVIYPEGHWLSRYKEIDLSQLANEEFLSAIKGYGIRDIAETFFEKAGIAPPITVASTDTSLIQNYVKNNVGIAFCPMTTIIHDDFLMKHHIIIKNPPCIGKVALTWKKDRYNSRVSKLFRAFAREYFEKLSLYQI